MLARRKTCRLHAGTEGMRGGGDEALGDRRRCVAGMLLCSSERREEKRPSECRLPGDLSDSSLLYHGKQETKKDSGRGGRSNTRSGEAI